MKRTKERTTNYPIAVDIEKLAAMLSCGKDTARKIADDAEAKIIIGRRTLYSVQKIELYISKNAF